jgi:hypothetical protein
MLDSCALRAAVQATRRGATGLSRPAGGGGQGRQDCGCHRGRFRPDIEIGAPGAGCATARTAQRITRRRAEAVDAAPHRRAATPARQPAVGSHDWDGWTDKLVNYRSSLDPAPARTILARAARSYSFPLLSKPLPDGARRPADRTPPNIAVSLNNRGDIRQQTTGGTCQRL